MARQSTNSGTGSPLPYQSNPPRAQLHMRHQNGTTQRISTTTHPPTHPAERIIIESSEHSSPHSVCGPSSSPPGWEVSLHTHPHGQANRAPTAIHPFDAATRLSRTTRDKSSRLRHRPFQSHMARTRTFTPPFGSAVSTRCVVRGPCVAQGSCFLVRGLRFYLSLFEVRGSWLVAHGSPILSVFVRILHGSGFIQCGSLLVIIPFYLSLFGSCMAQGSFKCHGSLFEVEVHGSWFMVRVRG